MIKEAKINKSTHIYYLNCLRAIATLAVIIIHISADEWFVLSVTSCNWLILNAFISLCRFSVPIFVMISGALFLDSDKSVNYKNLYGKKAVRIITAFLFWSFIYTLFEIIEKNGLSKKQILLHFFNGYHHLWFLSMILGLYLIIPLLRLLFANEKAVKYFLILWLAISVIIPQTITIANMLPSLKIGSILQNKINDFHLSFCEYSGYFVLGCYLNKKELSKRIRRLIYILSVIGFTATFLLTFIVSVLKSEPSQLFYGYFSVNVVLEALGIFVFFKYKSEKILGKFKKIIAFLSKYSFGVYLSHALVIWQFEALTHLTPTFISPIISVPAFLIIIALISYLISFVLSKIPIFNKYFV